jgi:hypothetical protein
MQPHWDDGLVGLAMTQFEMGEFEDSIANVIKARKSRKKKDKLIADGQ